MVVKHPVKRSGPVLPVIVWEMRALDASGHVCNRR